MSEKRIVFPNLPARITREQIIAAHEALGLPASGTKSILIRPGSVEITSFLKDSDGRLVAAGTEALRQTLTIPIVDL